MRPNRTASFIAPVTLGFIAVASLATAKSGTSIHQGTLLEPNQKTLEVSTEELRKILADRRSFVLDARPFMEYAVSHVPGALNLPASGLKSGKDVGEVKKTKDDGRLPMEDHNTRIVVFGRDGAQARLVAEAVVNEAFHNVAFYDGPFATIKAAAH